MYEKQTAKIIPFRSIDIFENAVSAGTGNFLVDGPKETVRIDESIQRQIVKDFLIKFTKNLQKRCQKHSMAPDTSFDRLHLSVQQVFA